MRSMYTEMGRKSATKSHLLEKYMWNPTENKNKDKIFTIFMELDIHTKKLIEIRWKINILEHLNIFKLNI